jgi:hypothetical protein
VANLEPVAAAVAGLVEGGQPFQDDAFETEFAAGFNEGAALSGEGRRDAEVFLGQGQAVEQSAALGIGAAQ